MSCSRSAGATFDFANQRIHVRRNFTSRREKAPKSGKVRSVLLVAELVPALDALSLRERFTDLGDLVLANQVGSHLCSFALRRRFYAALDAAGLGHLRDAPRPFVFQRPAALLRLDRREGL